MASTLSDYHIKKIIRCYADELSPSEAARRVRVSYPTVLRIYQLLRRRLIELGVYVAPHGDDTLETRRSGETVPLLLRKAEAIFRHERRKLDLSGPAISYFQLLRLVQLSGPLNRPLTRQGILAAISFSMDRVVMEAFGHNTKRLLNRLIEATDKAGETQPTERNRAGRSTDRSLKK